MISKLIFFSYLLSFIHSFPIHNQLNVNKGFIKKCSQLKMSFTDLRDINVMVNGIPGPMATATAEACLRKGLVLSPIAMTGPEIPPSTVTIRDKVTGKSCDVRLIPSTNVKELESTIEGIRVALDDTKNTKLLAIDYTHPSAVNNNAKFYVSNSIPFVMGTTGGNRPKLLNDVEGSFAVIAPNMAKQIVAMQAGLEYLATKFPNSYGGYKLDITESHQTNKADTSGTAMAVMDSLVKLSSDSFEGKDIEKIRTKEGSLAFGVPEEHLKGHAFHTYTLTSTDGSVQFQLKHNVGGRTVYAEGTVDAVKFLANKVSKGGPGKIYNMIDVLEERQSIH